MSDREITPYQRIAELERNNAIQGLHLATMADVVLGEGAKDRSDETLVREVCKMAREHAALQEKVDDWENAVLHSLDHRPDEKHCTCVPPLIGKVRQLERENAALRADKERLDWLAVSDEWFDVPAAESFIADTFRAAIDAARKEKP